jgi:hypothetical protein
METPPNFIPEEMAWSFDYSSTSQEDRKYGRADISKSNPSALPVSSKMLVSFLFTTEGVRRG